MRDIPHLAQWEARTWSENALFEFDPERLVTILEGAKRIRNTIEAEGITNTVDEIPFEPYGCYVC